MTALLDWFKQHVWLVTALSTAVVLYWRFLDRPQKLHERQNTEFRKVLEEKLYEKEDKNLELEIAFRYCFNRFLRAYEIRWLLKKGISLLDLEAYSYLRSNSILDLNDNKINFIGPCKPLNNWVVRKLILILIFLASILLFSGPFLLSYQNQPQQSVQPIDTFILSLCSLFFGFLYLQAASLILRGQHLRSEYNHQS